MSFVGGRGKKAPYKTSVVRVPVPVLEQVEKIIQEYRDSLETGLLPPSVGHPTKAIAIQEAEKIIKQKKSARVSMQILIDRLWG
jgi:thiamine phosphate synthase YjbQ (UPF0047 family)